MFPATFKWITIILSFCSMHMPTAVLMTLLVMLHQVSSF